MVGIAQLYSTLIQHWKYNIWKRDIGNGLFKIEIAFVKAFSMDIVLLNHAGSGFIYCFITSAGSRN